VTVTKEGSTCTTQSSHSSINRDQKKKIDVTWHCIDRQAVLQAFLMTVPSPSTGGQAVWRLWRPRAADKKAPRPFEMSAVTRPATERRVSGRPQRACSAFLLQIAYLGTTTVRNVSRHSPGHGTSRLGKTAACVFRIPAPNSSPVDFLLSLKGQYQLAILVNDINMATVVVICDALQSLRLVRQHAVQLDTLLSAAIKFQLRCL